MSRSVEERIVEMQFDNDQFESGIKTSIQSLDKLSQKLKLKDASSGLNELQSSASNLDFSHLASAIDTINRRFSTLGIAGMKAISNITDSAIRAGKQLISSLTIDPVKTGFSEYETQIDAIQTILANTKSKGSTLEDVNTALDDLNHYADMTIYNFTEMTRNIGRFTAAGVDLETSTTAIKGIANLAAVSGSTSQQASMAMYQLSQALASGTIKLMDWNSVVNAGMGGEVFQNALIETARAAGTTIPKTVKEVDAAGKSVSKTVNMTIDELIESNGSFRESLSTGWLTADLLNETLLKFTETTEGLTEAQVEQKRSYWRNKGYTDQQIDDIFELGKTATDAATKVKTFSQLMETLQEAAQSGWTSSWEIIIGDFEQAKELMTSLSDRFGDIISASADARNKILETWARLGGRKILIDTFEIVFSISQDFISAIKASFQKVFPSLTGRDLLKLTSSLKSGTHAIYSFLWSPMSENDEWPVIHYIEKALKGFSAILGIASEAIQGLFHGIGLIGQKLDPFGRFLIQTAGELGEWVYSLYEGIRDSQLFQKAIEGLVNSLDWLFKGLVPVGQAIKTWIIDRFNELSNSDFTNGIGDLFQRIRAAAPGAAKALIEFGKAQWEAIKNSEGFRKAVADVKEFLKPLSDWAKSIAGKVSDGFKKMLDMDTSGISDFGEKAKARINEFLESLDISAPLEKIKAGWEKLKAIFSKASSGVDLSWLKTIGINIRDFVLSIDLAGIATSGINFVFEVIGNLVSQLFGLLDHIDTGKIFMLAEVFKVLGKAKLFSSIGGVMKSVSGFIGTAKKALAEKFDVKGAAASFVEKVESLAESLLRVAAAIVIIGSMPLPNVAQAVGVIAVLAIIAGALTKFTKEATGFDGKGFRNFGVALLLMAIPIKVLGGMEWGQLGKAGAAIAGLAVIVGVLTAVSKKSSGFKGGGNFIALAFALNLIMVPIMILGAMSWESLGKAGAAIAGLAVIVGVLTAVSKKSSGFKGGGNFIALAFALNVLAPAIKTLGDMEWDKLGKAAVAMVGLVVIVALLGEAVKIFQSVSVTMAVKFAAVVVIIAAGIAAALAIFAGIMGGAATALTREFVQIAPNLVYISDTMGNLNTDGMENGVAMLGKLGEAITKIPSIDRGAIDNFSYAALRISSAISLFAFTAKDVSENPAVNTVADTIAGIPEKFKKVTETDLEQTVSAIIMLGAAMKLFGEMQKSTGVDGSFKTGSGVNFGAWIDELSKNMPDPSKILDLQKYASGGSNDAFLAAAGITAIGSALESYQTSVATIDPEQIALANSVLNQFNQIENELVSFERIVAQVFALGNLTDFGTRINDVGISLAGYMRSINSVTWDQDAINASTSIITNLSSVEKAGLGKSTFAVWMGNIGDFASQLVSVGANMAQFMQTVGSVDFGDNDYESAIDRVAKAVDFINQLAIIDVAETETSLSPFLANGALGVIEDSIAGIGQGMASFMTSMSYVDMDATKIQAAVDTVGVLADHAIEINQIMAKAGELTTSFNWGDRGTAFGNAINGLSALFDTMAQAKSLTGTDISSFGALLTQTTESGIAQSAGDLATKFFEAFNSNFITAVTLAEVDASNKFKGLASACVIAVSDKRTDFENAGVNLGQGFIDGIVSMQGAAVTAASNMASAAAEALNRKLKVASPSKVTAQTGRYFSEGFTVGIQKTRSGAEKSAASLGQSIIAAFNGVLGVASPAKSTISAAHYFNEGWAVGINKEKKSAKTSTSSYADEILSSFNSTINSITGTTSGLSKDITNITQTFTDEMKTQAKDIYSSMSGDLDEIKKLMGDDFNSEWANIFTYLDLNNGEFKDENTAQKIYSSLTGGASSKKSSSGSSSNVSSGSSSGSSSSGNYGDYSYEQAADAQTTVKDLARIKDLLDAISNVSARVTSLGEAVTGMQIVMDSGVMVGQIETKMDQRLGSIAALKGRGL